MSTRVFCCSSTGTFGRIRWFMWKPSLGVCFVMFVFFFSQGYHSESLFNKALAAFKIVRYVHISIIRRLFIFLHTLDRNMHVSQHATARMTHVHLPLCYFPLPHLIPFCHSISQPSLRCSSQINVSWGRSPYPASSRNNVLQIRPGDYMTHHSVTFASDCTSRQRSNNGQRPRG